MHADDEERFVKDLEDFPAAKAAWQKQQARLQKQAAGPGKTAKQLAEGDPDPEISGSDDDDAKLDVAAAENDDDDDEDAENQPGPSKGKKAAAAAVKGGKQGQSAGRGRAASKTAPKKAAKAQGTWPCEDAAARFGLGSVIKLLEECHAIDSVTLPSRARAALCPPF